MASVPAGALSTEPSKNWQWTVVAWYLLYFGSQVTIFPFLGAWFIRRGLINDQQWGLVNALRTWTSLPASFLWGVTADRLQAHHGIMLGCFGAAAVVRCVLIGFAADFATVLVLVLTMQVLISPVGVLADAAVVAGCKDNEYGKYRKWGAVGWGIFSLVSGSIIPQWGMSAALILHLLLSIPCFWLGWTLQQHKSTSVEAAAKQCILVARGPSSSARYRRLEPVMEEQEEGDGLLEATELQPLCLQPGSKDAMSRQTDCKAAKDVHGHHMGWSEPSDRQHGDQHGDRGAHEATDAVNAVDAGWAQHKHGWDRGQMLGVVHPPHTPQQHVPFAYQQGQQGHGFKDGLTDGADGDQHALLGHGLSKASQAQDVRNGPVHKTSPRECASSFGQGNVCVAGLQGSSSSSDSHAVQVPSSIGNDSSSSSPSHSSDNNSMSPNTKRQTFIQKVLQLPWNRANVHVPASSARSSCSSPKHDAQHTSAGVFGKEPSSSQSDVQGCGNGVLAMLSRWQVVRFLCMATLMGYGFGTIEFSLFVFLQELGSTELLWGLSISITCAAEAPVFEAQTWLLARFGINTLLGVVLLTYAIRMVLYASLRKPWMVLLIEPLHGITFGLGWGVGTTNCKRLAPPDLVASMQGVFQGCYFGLGYGLGALVGGIISQRHGYPFMYLTGAGVVVAGGLLLFGSQVFQGCAAHTVAWVMAFMRSQRQHAALRHVGRPAPLQATHSGGAYSYEPLMSALSSSAAVEA